MMAFEAGTTTPPPRGSGLGLGAQGVGADAAEGDFSGSDDSNPPAPSYLFHVNSVDLT